jgi:hypothetical protein
MNELASDLIWAAALLGAVATICLTGLKAWRAWIDLRREEIAARAGEAAEGVPAAMIEMSSVKERLRRLEAIARGVDL